VQGYEWRYLEGDSVSQTLLISSFEVDHTGAQTRLSRFEIRIEADLTILEADRDRLLLSVVLRRIEPTAKISPSLEEEEHLQCPFTMEESVEDWSYWRRQRQLRTALRYPLLFLIQEQRISLIEEGLEERFKEFDQVLHFLKERVIPWLLHEQFTLRTKECIESEEEDRFIMRYEKEEPNHPNQCALLSWQKPSLLFTLDEVSLSSHGQSQLVVSRRITSK
jgi:hypothetical protein